MDIKQLYKQLILDHKKHPKNFGELEHASHKAEGFNPLCGDHFWFALLIADNKISDIKFHGQGCAISTATSSLLTSAIKGQSLEQAESILETFGTMVMGSGTGTGLEEGLLALSGVKDFPTRIKCAILPAHTISAAITGSQMAVKTE